MLLFGACHGFSSFLLGTPLLLLELVTVADSGVKRKRTPTDLLRGSLFVLL